MWDFSTEQWWCCFTRKPVKWKPLDVSCFLIGNGWEYSQPFQRSNNFLFSVLACWLMNLRYSNNSHRRIRLHSELFKQRLEISLFMVYWCQCVVTVSSRRPLKILTQLPVNLQNIPLVRRTMFELREIKLTGYPEFQGMFDYSRLTNYSIFHSASIEPGSKLCLKVWLLTYLIFCRYRPFSLQIIAFKFTMCWAVQGGSDRSMSAVLSTQGDSLFNVASSKEIPLLIHWLRMFQDRWLALKLSGSISPVLRRQHPKYCGHCQLFHRLHRRKQVQSPTRAVLHRPASVTGRPLMPTRARCGWVQKMDGEKTSNVTEELWF